MDANLPPGATQTDTHTSTRQVNAGCHLDAAARAELHDNVPAHLPPRWQKARQSRATAQPRCTDVPSWVITSAVQPTFCDSDRFKRTCRGRQLAGTQQVQPWRRVGLGRCRATQPCRSVGQRRRVLTKNELMTNASRPDVTFGVDWTLRTNYIYLGGEGLIPGWGAEFSPVIIMWCRFSDWLPGVFVPGTVVCLHSVHSPALSKFQNSQSFTEG